MHERKPASANGRARCVFLKAFDRQFDAALTRRALAADGVEPRASMRSTASVKVGFSRVWAGALLSVLAPADCRVCDGPLLEARRSSVCATCLSQVQAECALLCARCGERLDAEDASGYGFSRADAASCEACHTAPPPFVRATAYAGYDGVLRSLIRLHKFEGVAQLAEPLGERLAPVMAETVATLPAGLVHVVAVPLHRHRRRFNQSAQIADAALRRVGGRSGAHRIVVRHDALVRIRATESQSHLSPAQRRENVRGAFAVRGDVCGWQIVLVDDVYTTGATVRECAQTLLRAGAAAVHVVTLARTQPERVALWQPAGHAKLIEQG